MTSLTPNEIRQYPEIIKDLDDFDSYLTGLGLRRAHDRLRHLIANIRKMQDAVVQGRVAALSERSDTVELVWSLVEGQEFAIIFRGLRDYDTATMCRLMKKVLDGPFDPSRESTRNASNVGRNTAFELCLGARMRLAGGEVQLGDDADVRLNHAGTHIYIECKRPFGAGTVAKNIREARAQLRRRFAADQHAKTLGFVAISLSRAINPGQQLFEVDDEAGLASLSRDVERIRKTESSALPIDPRFLGTIYHIYTPAFVRRERQLFAASHWEVFANDDNLHAMLPVSWPALKELILRAGNTGVVQLPPGGNARRGVGP